MEGGPDLRVLASPEAVAAAAAQEVATLARAAMAARGRFVLALSGGATPRRLYQRLAEPAARAAIDWQRVELFWGDERMVPPDHPDSNYGMARAALLSAVGVPAGHVHRIRGEADPAQAARAYQAEIARTLGVAEDGPPPVFDLVLLGMGPDGHTASLFPGGEALAETRRWVVVSAGPTAGARVTLTLPLMNRARHLRVLVTGSDKAATLAVALEGPPASPPLPVQLLAPAAGRLAWLVDEAAAAGLAARPER